MAEYDSDDDPWEEYRNKMLKLGMFEVTCEYCGQGTGEYRFGVVTEICSSFKEIYSKKCIECNRISKEDYCEECKDFKTEETDYP
jgi:hypothetical protein